MNKITFKSIREDKNLTQQQCADILGISRRSYQYLEKDNPDNPHSKKLLETLYNFVEENYYTHVIKGSELLSLFNKVKSYKKRYCYKYLLDYVKGNYQGKVCILYGLRRTGKTTMLFQLIKELPLSQIAYIKIKESNDMAMLIKDLNALKKVGVKYVFIDEVTLLDDFINSSGALSDIYSMLNMKIILTGTDSLGFKFADGDELYDRNIMIHTSYISFKEFSYILDIKDIDTYIEYGGTFKIENMDFDDPDYKKDEVAFLDDESTRKYIDTSITRNIQRSIKNNHFGSELGSLKRLYENDELTNAINRIINDMNHEFILSVVNSKFKSSDLGSAKQLLLKHPQEDIQTALYDIDEYRVIKALKDIINVKEKEELVGPLLPGELNQIKYYLISLDLIKTVEVRHDDNTKEERIIFTQPGMRYSLVKALIYSLKQDEYFRSLSNKTRQIVIEKILSDVKGRMLEDIVLLETSIRNKKYLEVFKYRTLSNKEIDMVIYDSNLNTFSIYEIKHTDIQNLIAHSKYLKDNEVLSKLEHEYGTLTNRYILYKGKTDIKDEISYLNVEEFLTK